MKGNAGFAARARYVSVFGSICLLIAALVWPLAARGGTGSEDPAEWSGDGSSTSGQGDSGPTVHWMTPRQGQQISKTISLWVVASGPDPIARVDFTVDGFPVGTDLTSPYSVELDTIFFPDGTHTLGARAVDIWGREGFGPIAVPIDNICPGGPPCFPTPMPVRAGLSADKSRVCMASDDPKKIGDFCRLDLDCGDNGQCKTLAQVIQPELRNLVFQVFWR